MVEEIKENLAQDETPFDKLEAVEYLEMHYEKIKKTHLKDLLKNEERNRKLRIETENFTFDYSHENITEDTLPLFRLLANQSKLFAKMEEMKNGRKINKSENRSVMHMALRASKDESFIVDGENVVPEVHKILSRIKEFSTRVREGEFKGKSGKSLNTFVVIGIGGSYLGPEFVFEALKSEKHSREASRGFRLKFLANVDPVDFLHATEDIDFERTLFIICSKTFTTAETMLNARTCKDWLFTKYSPTLSSVNEDVIKDLVAHHMCAVSTNVPLAREFGINPNNVFGFWEWVGGRFSVCSAIGVLPLSLYYGFSIVEQFLKGAECIDKHFFQEKHITKNVPLMLGMIGFWNTHFQKLATRAILPYSQALLKFAPHIQQLNMESNGKGVTNTGKFLTAETCPIIFGEPGTNGQHSFYQLIHQGRVVPCEFIGFIKSQNDISVPRELVDNQDELMSNFFAQPDALAYGKEGDPAKFFTGNRPSLMFLFKSLNAFTCGQLLAIYEHRVAVEGFLYGINSFDQMGVELGKVLAKDVRQIFGDKKKGKKTGEIDLSHLNSSTRDLIIKYMETRDK